MATQWKYKHALIYYHCSKMVLDEIYKAMALYRQRKYDQCVDLCNKLMVGSIYQKMAYELKMRAMTQRVYIDDIEADDGVEINEDIEEARPETMQPIGSALRTAHVKTAMNRPKTSTGRPLTGMNRPGTMAQRPGSTMNSRNNLRTRTGTARNIRLGSASMFAFADPNGPLLQLSQFNPKVYAQKQNAGVVFKFLYYHEGDVKKARDLCKAVIEHRAHRFSPDLWWWQQQLSRCHISLGPSRDAEQLLRNSLALAAHPDTVLLLARVYIKLDQPEAALEICRGALSNNQKFANDIGLMTQQARILELTGNLADSVKMYRQIGHYDAMNCEALASIAVHHFYASQPEIALIYYRRILIMGVHTCELFCNIGLCCLYCGQLDMVTSCFQRAIRLAASLEEKADVWYNFSFVAMNTGDFKLAKRCLRLCISADGGHGAALNNLALLCHRSGQNNKAKAYLLAAKSSLPNNEEIQFNSNKFFGGKIGRD